MTVIDSWTLFVVADPAACRDFYVDKLGFVVVFDSAWYVQVELPGERPFGLAFLEAGHQTQVAQHRSPTQGPRFVSLQFGSVESVDDLAQRLVDAGVRVDIPLRDEPWGQRHIVVEDPSGTFVDLIAAIEPDPAFAAAWLA